MRPRLINFLYSVFGPTLVPPVTSGLVGYYSSESYFAASNTWLDLSGSANHVVISAGSLTLTNATSNSPSILSGSTATKLAFPFVPASFLNPTVFNVARYKPSGGSYGRILQGCSMNWLSGLYAGTAGVACHNDNGWVTAQVGSLAQKGWVSSSDRFTNYRANGIDRSLVATTRSPTARPTADSGKNKEVVAHS